MKIDSVIETLASEIFFKGFTNENFEKRILELGYTYRSKQSFTDVQNALKKSRKNGMYKVEHELDFLALYLQKDILKKIR